MKIWIKKDYKKDHVVITFEDPKDGEIDPVLYIYIRVDTWVELDLDTFKKDYYPPLKENEGIKHGEMYMGEDDILKREPTNAEMLQQKACRECEEEDCKNCEGGMRYDEKNCNLHI